MTLKIVSQYIALSQLEKWRLKTDHNYDIIIVYSIITVGKMEVKNGS